MADTLHKVNGHNDRIEAKLWCAWGDSNSRPTVSKTDALSTELQAPDRITQILGSFSNYNRESYIQQYCVSVR